MPNVKITLEKPVTGHRAHRELYFREPKYPEYMELGEPFAWIPAGDMYRRIDDMPAIRQYAERLIVDADGKAGEPEVLAQLGVKDSRKVVEAIIGFFRDGEATAGSSTSPTNSSSTPDSTPEPSTASPSPA